VLVSDGRAPTVAKTTNSSVPLHLACYNNHTEAAMTLVTLMQEEGSLSQTPAAFTKYANNYGETPLQCARERGHAALVALLASLTGGEAMHAEHNEQERMNSLVEEDQWTRSLR
jgi:ankyrin repeat protein